MSDIVNTGTPSLTFKKEIRARLSCPNCDGMLDIDASEVDKGHVIKCGACKQKTYYPFERPWYRRKKLIIGYALSLLASFLVGLAVNYVYARLTSVDSTAATESERK